MCASDSASIKLGYFLRGEGPNQVRKRNLNAVGLVRSQTASPGKKKGGVESTSANKS